MVFHYFTGTWKDINNDIHHPSSKEERQINVDGEEDFEKAHLQC